jgi:CheY-like chemotaxis protein
MTPREQRLRDAATRSPLVLLVEDDADTRYLYAAVFLQQGWKVQAAEDGEIAIARAIDSRPDIIVMDLAMPHLDGWKATRRLKRDQRTSQIPIVACTAHAFGRPVEDALDAGCDAYIVKPCLPEDLFREVKKVLARSTARRRNA